MTTITMFREAKQQEWSDKGVDIEKFYDEAAVYGMIMMILNNDDSKPNIAAVDRAKAMIKHN